MVYSICAFGFRAADYVVSLYVGSIVRRGMDICVEDSVEELFVLEVQ